ncbi:tRNA pseudouridine38-40 synthase [Alkaliphilus hydrothermalis]|uniref:tRNA pseudouridine synthase A n=2 Tax=Alkaliphilus hydrothermalis TaxID=1482730 RepID=A0ABS2NPY6_9FIRM|nr:tRNA pseudouridine38-40 synthase [Alkaliphilus hydrothermalis]
MKRNIRMIIEYDGSRYKGWQRLKDTDQTIQGKIEAVISKMANTPIEIIGSGRTDAGAHAHGQVANFHYEGDMTLQEMKEYINHYLPQDIVVKEIHKASERFHSRYNGIAKRYVYYVWNDPVPSAFQRKYSYHIPEKLDIAAMKKAAELFLGTHDFIAFSSVKKTNKSTERTIKEINIERKGQQIEFSFIGDGFLHNMVRIMMGTLLEIGLGNEKPDYIERIFKEGKREVAGQTVPAQGLFLAEVYYD